VGLRYYREFMWTKRGNEHLTLKSTKRSQNDREPWEKIYKDVSDTAVSGLREREGEKYECSLRNTVGVIGISQFRV
jgi:hypothetical protein